MKVAIRLTLLGAVLLMSACAKKDVPPPDGPPKDPDPRQEVACEGCDWQNFVDKQIRIPWIECTTEQGQPVECNFTTDKGVPTREATVTRETGTGAFKWTLVSPDPGKDNDKMECTNLAQNPDNLRIIEGTCLIGNPDGTSTVHFFRVRLAPREDDTSKAGMFFWWRHKPFTSEQDPVHNCEGRD